MKSSKQDVSDSPSPGITHTLVDNLPQAIFSKNIRGKIKYANRSFCTQLGRNPDEIIGKTEFDLFPDKLARRYQEYDRKVIASCKPSDTLECCGSADAQLRYTHMLRIPVFNKTGKVSGIQVILTDMTQHIEAERCERDQLRMFLENVSDRFYFKDKESRFLMASSSLMERFHLTRDQLIGKSDFDLFSIEHAQAAFEDEQEIIRTGRPLVGKMEKETFEDGRTLWALTTKMPLKNAQGEIIGTFGISKDITALKRTEAELEAARDLALESARLKSEFLANMSHEIRTPMNAIIGMTGLILDTDLTEEQKDFADTIRSSAEALLTLINDILDFSKIESGKLAIELIDFDLMDLVESTVELVANRAHNKGIELVSCIQNDMPRNVCGDPSRTRQVLTNLLSNAVKFTLKGEVVLNVSLEMETESGISVCFSVSDTGIGISSKVLPLIFQPFTQADGSMTRKYGGTGLGLAISKRLVDLMNGRIEVESEVDKGSTFRFTLPFVRQKDMASSAKLRADLTGLRVLVVDDNEATCQSIHHQILSWNMRNGIASSAADALAILRQEAAAGDPYDVAIVDYQMDEIDGLGLAGIIKKDPMIAETHLLLLTSLGEKITQKSLQNSSISGVLVKPVKQSRLYDAIATAVSDSARGYSRPRHPVPPTPRSAKPISWQNALRVLLAEDNVVNQKVALRQLQKLGCLTDAVSNGREALEAAKQKLYDVILMDCQMPEMDGYEATEQIRFHEQSLKEGGNHKSHYIIAMTANAMRGDKERCLSAGMNDYISKPVHIEDLQAAIERKFEPSRSELASGDDRTVNLP